MPRKDLETSAFRSYRKHPGMIAWLLHRITGILLILYFIFHMLSSTGTCSFAGEVARNIYVEAVVVVMFAWHAMNGFRIIFMEFLKAAERACFKKGLVVFTILAVLLAAVGLYYVSTYISAQSPTTTETNAGE